MTTLRLLIPNDYALKQIKALAQDLGASVAEEATDTSDRDANISQAVAFWLNNSQDFPTERIASRQVEM